MCIAQEHSEMSNSKGWLELRVYLPNLVGRKKGEKGHLWKRKCLFGKINGPLGEYMRDMSVCGSVCLGVVLTSFLPEEKIGVASWRGLRTIEFFGEALSAFRQMRNFRNSDAFSSK